MTFWWDAEEWVPCSGTVGFGWSGSNYDLLHGPNYQLTDDDRKKAARIHQGYAGLQSDIKTRVQIPIDRLNRAIRRRSLADSAIELGIALEALFLTDIDAKEGEISFKVRLRGAWLLGENAKDRKRLMREFRDLYACRSVAVHTGKLDSTFNARPTKELLDYGKYLIAKGIETIIERAGFPDWNSIILGQ